MKGETAQNAFAAVVVVSLMALTAWGNAFAMFWFSAVGIAVAAVMFRKSINRSGILAATFSSIVAAAIALVIALQ